MGIALDVDSLEWAFEAGTTPFLSIKSLQIPPGATVAITGPSGSGKTSLLFILAGMERVSRGRIAWAGFDLATATERERDGWRRDKVGLVFQDFRLVDDLSVLDNVLLPTTFSHWRPGTALQERALELIRRMGLPNPGQAVGTLSRGEMQRTALARALLFKPPLIMADEPTASLDAKNEQVVWDLLFEAARREGATLLVATHQARIQEMADQVISLDHGKLASDGQQGAAV